uniref:SFRICE_031983 n=1 Tax=Spodoptera frugiperda TaxID=7108 RepID=A0A2H1WF15_SPOFR
MRLTFSVKIFSYVVGASTNIRFHIHVTPIPEKTICRTYKELIRVRITPATVTVQLFSSVVSKGEFVVGISTAGLISRFNECRGTYAVNAAHYLRNSRNDNKDSGLGGAFSTTPNITTMSALPSWILDFIVKSNVHGKGLGTHVLEIHNYRGPSAVAFGISNPPDKRGDYSKPCLMHKSHDADSK